MFEGTVNKGDVKLFTINKKAIRIKIKPNKPIRVTDVIFQLLFIRQ